MELFAAPLPCFFFGSTFKPIGSAIYLCVFERAVCKCSVCFCVFLWFLFQKKILTNPIFVGRKGGGTSSQQVLHGLSGCQDTVPKTAENFRALCTGEKAKGSSFLWCCSGGFFRQRWVFFC